LDTLKKEDTRKEDSSMRFIKTQGSTPRGLVPVLSAALAALLAVSLLAPLAACQGGEPAAEEPAAAPAGNIAAAGSVTFTDDLGTEITVENPQRVIATLASFADTWQLAGGTLVGVTDDATTLEGLLLPADVTTIGSYSELNVETIATLEPDFVILSSAPTYKQTEIASALAELGIPAAYFNITHFEDYLRMLKIFTDITGRADLYEANGLAVQTSIDGIEQQAADASTTAANGKQPTAFFIITSVGRGVAVQNSKTMAGRMLTELGVTNLADEYPSLLNEFSIEGLLEADPDYIFVLPMGNDPKAAEAGLKAGLEDNPAWAELRAVKEGRYIYVDQEHFLYKPNSRWAESYQILFDHLYG
jgi:iron complex transport system substrate-binding protein